MEMTQRQIETLIATGVEDGITNIIFKIAIGFVISVVIAVCVLHFSPSEKDSTDPIDGRSGLEIKVDAMTGCQYLTTTKSGLTPRLDANGKQICGGEK